MLRVSPSLAPSQRFYQNVSLPIERYWISLQPTDHHSIKIITPTIPMLRTMLCIAIYAAQQFVQIKNFSVSSTNQVSSQQTLASLKFRINHFASWCTRDGCLLHFVAYRYTPVPRSRKFSSLRKTELCNIIQEKDGGHCCSSSSISLRQRISKLSQGENWSIV